MGLIATILIALCASVSQAQFTNVTNSSANPVNVSIISNLASSGSSFAGTTNYIVNPVTATIVGLNSVTTSYIVNPVTATVVGLNSVTTTYVTNPTTTTITNLFNGTTFYLVNQASATAYIINNAGTGLIGVGYQTGSASVPVNIVNTVTVAPHNAIVFQSNVLGATITYNGTQTLNVATGAVSAASLLLVSSAATLPTQIGNAVMATQMADNQGRAVIMAGAPTSVYQATSPVTALAGYMVLVASPATTAFTHLIGCIFRNTSATPVSIDIYTSGNSANSPVQDFPIQLPAATQYSIFTGADKPFMNTTAGGVQVTAKVSAAVSSINGYCQFYQNTSP